MCLSTISNSNGGCAQYERSLIPTQGNIAMPTTPHFTQKQQLIAYMLLLLIISGAFIWFVFIPYNTEITQLEKEVLALVNDIQVHRTMARHLEELKRENLLLNEKLATLTKQFPHEAEVEVFLKQVSELGEKTGLTFKLWKPLPKQVHASGLYTEVPVDVEVFGEYHALGVFFDRISQLPRIINWKNLKMGNVKLENNRAMIETGFVATAFASAIAKGAVAAEPEKKPAFEGTL